MKDKIPASEILNKYYNTNDLIEIKLSDGTILTGKLISLFEDEDGKIKRWHFLDESEIEQYKKFLFLDGIDAYGKIIRNSDIISIKFK